MQTFVFVRLFSWYVCDVILGERMAILLSVNRLEVLVINVVHKHVAVVMGMRVFNGSRNASWHQAVLQVQQPFESLRLLSFEHHPTELSQ